MKVIFSCNTLFFAGWCSRICRSLGISQLHPLDVRLADVFMRYDRMRVVFTHNASCCLLNTMWSFPGLIDILGWELHQKRKVLSSKQSRGKLIHKRRTSLLTTRACSDSDLTWCSLHFCLSSCRTRQESRPWRTGGRRCSLRATASFRRSGPSRHPIKAPRTPSGAADRMLKEDATSFVSRPDLR